MTDSGLSAWSLNESPSEKEGKFTLTSHRLRLRRTLNESPSEKEGKSPQSMHPSERTPLNESPSEKEGKYCSKTDVYGLFAPSMKVPPKRKGNTIRKGFKFRLAPTLNESPSEKEGKCRAGVKTDSGNISGPQ